MEQVKVVEKSWTDMVCDLKLSVKTDTWTIRLNL